MKYNRSFLILQKILIKMTKQNQFTERCIVLYVFVYIYKYIQNIVYCCYICSLHGLYFTTRRFSLFVIKPQNNIWICRYIFIIFLVKCLQSYINLCKIVYTKKKLDKIQWNCVFDHSLLIQWRVSLNLCQKIISLKMKCYILLL